MRTDLKPCTQVTSSPPPSLLGSFTLGYPQGHTHPSWPSHVLCNRKNDQFKKDKLLHFCQQLKFLFLFPTSHPSSKVKQIERHMTTVPSRGMLFKLQWCPLCGIGSTSTFHHTGSSSNVTSSLHPSTGGVHVLSSAVGVGL